MAQTVSVIVNAEDCEQLTAILGDRAVIIVSMR